MGIKSLRALDFEPVSSHPAQGFISGQFFFVSLRSPSCVFVDNSFHPSRMNSMLAHPQAGTGFQRMAHSSDLPMAPAQLRLDSSSWVIPPTVRIMPSSRARLWLKPLEPSP